MFMKTLIIVLIIFIQLFLSSCGSKKEVILPSKVVCVLFDLSETTNTPEIRKYYKDKFKLILNKMNPADILEAALITEKSISELYFSIEYSFPVFDPQTDNKMISDAKRLQFDSLMVFSKDSLVNVADSVLFKPKRKILRTEILSSLQVAERVFKSFKQPRKVLVIFSDMIEESSIANFAISTPLESQTKSIVSTQKTKSLLPNLQDVTVYCVGATAKQTDDYNSIRKFWMTYFKETGANLKDYGAALIKFDE